MQKDGFWHNVNGSVLVTVYGKNERYRYGDELVLEVELTLPKPPSNPGGFNYREYLRRQKVYSTIKVGKTDVVHLLGSNRANPIAYKVFGFKDITRKIVSSNIPKEEASILAGILLGDRENIPVEMMDEFIKTGTIHILAISGLNVGLVAFIILAFFKLLHIPRRWRYFLTILFLIVYCIMTGGRPSVVRATIMAVVLLFGLAIDRDSDILNSLAVSALALLIFNPFYLFDPGFQLSFLTVIAIVILTPKLEGFIKMDTQEEMVESWHFKTKRFIVKSISVSLSAWLGIIPLIAYYSNTFSPVTVLINLILIPLVTLATAIGFTLLISGIVSITLTKIFGAACWLSLVGLTKVVSSFSNMPFSSWRVSTPSIIFVLCYYIFLLICINYRQLRLSMGKVAIIGLFMINLFTWERGLESGHSSLKITFLDVGHGDAIFIEFPHSGNMLIDGGEGGDDDRGRWVISPFLWDRGITRIDTVLLTHPHSDHVGGLATVMRNFKVRYVLDNRMPFNSTIYQGYNDMITKKRLNQRTVREGEEITGYKDVELYLLHPPPEFMTETSSYENDNSIVVKVIYKGKSILLCGDIEKAGIRNLLRYDEGLLNSTVLKVPHHGSYEEEETDLFFSRVSPQVAVIPEAERNKFNLPSTNTVIRLKESGAKVYQTGINGAVMVEIKDDNYSITCYRKTD
jgi:competence protein ComEC